MVIVCRNIYLRFNSTFLRFRTIVILSVVYCIGNMFMAVTAIPFGGYYNT